MGLTGPMPSWFPGCLYPQTWAQRCPHSEHHIKAARIGNWVLLLIDSLKFVFLLSWYNLYKVNIKIKLNNSNQEMLKTCKILSNLRSRTHKFQYLQTNDSFHNNGFYPPNSVLHFLVHRCPICFANGRNALLFLCSLNSKLNKKSDIIAFWNAIAS